MEGVLRSFLLDHPQPKDKKTDLRRLQLAQDTHCGTDYNRVGTPGYNRTEHITMLEEVLLNGKVKTGSGLKSETELIPALSPKTKSYISASIYSISNLRAKYQALLRFIGTPARPTPRKDEPLFTMPGRPNEKKPRSNANLALESRFLPSSFYNYDYDQRGYRSKRQVFALAAALGLTAFISGTYVSQIGLRSSIDALASNQKHMAAQLSDVTHTLNNVTNALGEWSTTVAHLGHLYDTTYEKTVELDFGLYALDLKLKMAQDEGRLNALIDALTNHQNAHELMTRYLSEEILDDSLARLRSAASMHGMRIDPEIRLVQQLFQFPIHGVYDMQNEAFYIIVSIPLYGDHDKYEVHEFIPTPQKIVRPEGTEK